MNLVLAHSDAHGGGAHLGACNTGIPALSAAPTTLSVKARSASSATITHPTVPSDIPLKTCFVPTTFEESFSKLSISFSLLMTRFSIS